MKRPGLGRGLGALIQEANEEQKSKPEGASINEIDVELIEANPWQPRSNFDKDSLDELAASIRAVGIIQPLTLRKVADDKYQIIAGERRFRASKLAGLTAVPAYVRDAGDESMLELALIENIQRYNLDPIEEALSYQRLIEECSLTQENMADRVGKKRSTITNYLRLLKLPAEIQVGLRERKISMGHARAIINVDDQATQIMLYEQTLQYEYSVRKVEELVREFNGEKPEDDPSDKGKNKKHRQQLPQEYDLLKQRLSDYFGTKIKFDRADTGKGKITIPFTSDKELENIMAILDKAK